MSSTRTRPSMTRRHFDAIAQAIAGMQGANLRERFARTLVPALQQFNESFDEERFVQVATGGRRVRRRSESFSRISREIGEGLALNEVPSGTGIVSPWYGRIPITDTNDAGPSVTDEVLYTVVELTSGSWFFVGSFNSRRLTNEEQMYVRFDVSQNRHVLSSIYVDNSAASEQEFDFPRATPAQQANSLMVIQRNGLWAFYNSENRRCLVPGEVRNLYRGAIGNPSGVILPIDRIIRWVVTPASDNGDYENLWGDTFPSFTDGGPPIFPETDSTPPYYYTLQRPSYVQQQIDRYLV